MITDALLLEWQRKARRDDCFTSYDAFVPSDIRQMIGEIQRLRKTVSDAQAWIERVKETGISEQPRSFNSD